MSSYDCKLINWDVKNQHKQNLILDTCSKHKIVAKLHLLYIFESPGLLFSLVSVSFATGS